MMALQELQTNERSVMEFVMNKAGDSGTPFLSLFSPDEIVKLAINAGCRQVDYESARDIYQRNFADRSDGLDAGNAEAFIRVNR